MAAALHKVKVELGWKIWLLLYLSFKTKKAFILNKTDKTYIVKVTSHDERAF
jgi:hypothetical protein